MPGAPDIEAPVGAQLLLAAGLVIAAIGGGGSAAAEEPGAARPGALVERATTELVLIEVYVIDSKGRPIRGLTADDFVLKVDQQTRPKPIASLEFYEGVPGAPRAAPPPRPEAPAPEGIPAPRVEPRRFVLFFEDDTSAPSGLTAARHAVETFIAANLSPTDLVALASYDFHRKLRVLLDFTTDRTALLEALRGSVEDRGRISDFAAEREKRRNELRKAQAAAQFGHASDAEDVRFKSLHYAREDVVRMSGVLRAVRTLVEALAPWPGYKAIVFMGEGVPENPAEDYYLLDPQQSLQHEITDIAYAAGSSGVTLHTVQTTGLAAGDADAVGSVSRRSNALSTLAMNTGGIALVTNDMPQALADVEESSQAYYLLGYEPEGPPDGLYHTVNIKVTPRNARLRYRRGFTRLRPDQARERTIQAAHLVPELYPDLGLQLCSVPGPAGGGDRVADLVLYVPADRILFVPGEGGPTARLEIGIVAIGDGGKESFRVARTARVTIPPDLAASWRTLGLNFYSRVHLPGGEQSVTAVVSDVQGGATGAARRRLAAPPRDGRDVMGLSLYSMAERSLWVDLESDGRTGRGAESAAEFTLGPALRNRFAQGEPLACGFRAGASGAHDLEVVIAQGERVVRRAPPLVEEGPGGTVKVELPVEGLPAGDYTLLVQEMGPGGATERGRLTFAIDPAPARR